MDTRLRTDLAQTPIDSASRAVTALGEQGLVEVIGIIATTR